MCDLIRGDVVAADDGDVAEAKNLDGELERTRRTCVELVLASSD